MSLHNYWFCGPTELQKFHLHSSENVILHNSGPHKAFCSSVQRKAERQRKMVLSLVQPSLLSSDIALCSFPVFISFLLSLICFYLTQQPLLHSYISVIQSPETTLFPTVQGDLHLTPVRHCVMDLLIQSPTKTSRTQLDASAEVYLDTDWEPKPEYPVGFTPCIMRRRNEGLVYRHHRAQLIVFCLATVGYPGFRQLQRPRCVVRLGILPPHPSLGLTVTANSLTFHARFSTQHPVRLNAV